MRTIFVLLVTHFILIYSGCRDEIIFQTIKSYPGPTGDTTLLFSDSLGLSSSDSGNIGLVDSVLYNFESAFMQLKLEYHLKSTGGTVPDNIYYGIFISTPDSLYFADYGTIALLTDINITRILNISSHSGMTAKFKVAIFNKGDHSYRYIYLKNIKLSSILIITP